MVNGLEQKMALRAGGGAVFEKSACKIEEVGYNYNQKIIVLFFL